MVKKIMLIVAAGLIFNCQDKSQNLYSQEVQSEKSPTEIDSATLAILPNSRPDNKSNSGKIIDMTAEEGKKWLKNSIEGEFNEGEGNLKNLCTKQYTQFKTDAMGMDYDGGLTDSEFEKKWNSKYNLDLVTKGSFLLGLQDYTKIKITSVELKKITDSGIWYGVKIKDIGFNYVVSRDIRIVRNGSSFLIDEVLERD